MRTARARPSRGTCRRSSSPRSPSTGWSSTRSPRTPSATPSPTRASSTSAGRRPGDPPHPRPPLRLRGLAGPVEEGHAEAVGGPRPVGGDPPRRRAGARAHRLPLRRVLGPDRHLLHRPRRRRLRPVHAGRPAEHGRRQARVAQGRDFGSDGQLKSERAAPRRGERPGARRRPGGHRLRRAVGRVQAVPPLAVRPVPYDDAPAGGRRKLGFGAKATMQVAQKLYENGFITYMRTDSTTLSETAVSRGPGAGHAAVRRRLPAGEAAGTTPARSRTPRRRTRRSAPRAIVSAPRPRPA